jgi:hypothetical protein
VCGVNIEQQRQQKQQKKSSGHKVFLKVTLSRLLGCCRPFVRQMSSTNEAKKNALGYPLLQTVTPVPSDIAISQQVVASGALLSMEKVGQQYVQK